MDKEILKALGYTDGTLEMMQRWETEVDRYFENEEDANLSRPNYYQADYRRKLIAFREECPRQIAIDLLGIFNKVFHYKKAIVK